MHFNRLNHAVKEHALNARVHWLTPSLITTQANVYVHYVGVSWVLAALAEEIAAVWSPEI